MRSRVVVCVLLFISLVARSVDGSCALPKSRDIVLREIVLLGTVTDVRNGDAWISADVRSEEWFVGDHQKTVEIRTPKNDFDRAPLHVGKRYLVFPWRDSSGNWVVDQCSCVSEELAKARLLELRGRVIGTTEQDIQVAEAQIGRRLPVSFRAWLLANNGRPLAWVNVFPVLDGRAPTLTGEVSDNKRVGVLVWQLKEGWPEAVAKVPGGDYSHLLPFAEVGSGDYYCFDYSAPPVAGEAPVVFWNRSTGEALPRAGTFEQFAAGVLAGSISD